MRTSTTLLLAALATAASSKETCCTLLHSSLGSKITFPGQPSYNNTQSSYWSLSETTLTPSCILLPSSSLDISHALSLLSSTAECALAIKGRGHNPGAGFANINGGVTIDMTTLSSTTVNADRSIASVEAGASWVSVYQTLDPLGVAVAGGRNGVGLRAI